MLMICLTINETQFSSSKTETASSSKENFLQSDEHWSILSATIFK
jgi:hypothetical protein